MSELFDVEDGRIWELVPVEGQKETGPLLVEKSGRRKRRMADEWEVES